MITFRTATQHDLPELVNFVNSAYRGDSSKAGWTTEADLLDGQRTDEGKLSEMIEATDSRIELAFEDKLLLGCVYLSKLESALYLGMLTVRPGLQNKGLGKLLLQRAEDIARASQLKKIRMTVINSRTELISFYERRGYKFTGETEPFPENDPRFGIPKQKLLFHVFEKILSE